MTSKAPSCAALGKPEIGSRVVTPAALSAADEVVAHLNLSCVSRANGDPQSAAEFFMAAVGADPALMRVVCLHYAGAVVRTLKLKRRGRRR